ncbi:YopX family protein [Clostridium perfringens]|nr:YopX family protein [Clostridium perfringens]
MSREVKFRIWDKTSNRMLYQDDFERVELDTKNKMVSLVRSETIESSYVLDYEDGIEAEIMQYTGLKDKNGKKVYEDDIIQYSHKAVGMILRKVRMKYGMWGIEGIVKGTQIPFANILESEYEVIGNIHENPELLEGEK